VLDLLACLHVCISRPRIQVAHALVAQALNLWTHSDSFTHFFPFPFPFFLVQKQAAAAMSTASFSLGGSAVLGGPGGGPFGGGRRVPDGQPAAQKGQQRWEKERVRLGSCGLTVLSMRSATFYVSGSVLFVLTKNAHSLAQGSHRIVGGFGGLGGHSLASAITVDQA
jgi:hypothetical protein